ncbi:heme oxygenase [Rhizobium sp. RU20A]|uniref:biliverdin-producing heme oxygenase n=1 Tax=Rhizobium sp. RU20A TaxID=1907412 RepID=UPI0009572F88|nr:biliverdin-producing heme oxygenase [Rhizobium sp. RU20A]SIR00692.1 heme oxygenase [Rhizobium sp. RU20A]
MQPTNRRFDLRERTRNAHDTVDRLVGVWKTRADYVDYLRSIHLFRSRYEAALDAIVLPACFRDWSTGQAVPEATRDLADLGVRRLPPVDKAVIDTDISSLLGTLYVLEGSGLGARLLCQRALALGLTADSGARHLFLLAGRVDAWRAFGAILENAPIYDAGRAVRAAERAFGDAAEAFGGAFADA